MMPPAYPCCFTFTRHPQYSALFISLKLAGEEGLTFFVRVVGSVVRAEKSGRCVRGRQVRASGPLRGKSRLTSPDPFSFHLGRGAVKSVNGEFGRMGE